jgi:hypothetical protein
MLASKPVVSPTILQPANDTFLQKILRRCGAYYHPADLFYQELLRDRLRQIGFRVLLIEKLPYHEVWDVRVCVKLASQVYLLASKPPPKRIGKTEEMLVKQFQKEIQAFALDLGPPIRNDSITVVRTGAYLRASFIWPEGKPGRLLKKEKPAEAFSFLIRPWVRRNRN